MSREIKFRIFAATDDGLEMIYLSELDCDNGLWFESHKHIDEYSETIMQYTGLKDKNGKDVYEGDIVQCYRSGKKFKNDIYFIKYDERSFIMALDDADTSFDCIWFSDFEVIGNIYENPKLKP